MSQVSRQITSNQLGIHPRLAATVQRHLESDFQRPIAPYSKAAFDRILAALKHMPRPLVLDSFCGTGHSTATLARRHPHHLVIGVDQSAHRLNKHQSDRGSSNAPENYLLLQASCEDIWHLLIQHQMTLSFHYLLYPNPWPKAAHLQRRVHGHGSFPWLIELGGAIELRSNWKTYVEEFCIAMHLSGRKGDISQASGDPAITLFEEKYRNSGHALWCFKSAPLK